MTSINGRVNNTEQKFQRVKLTKVPQNIRSQDRNSTSKRYLNWRKVPEFSFPGEGKYQEANWPGSYWNFHSRSEIDPGTGCDSCRQLLW